jgi:selenide,water dikinase
MTTLNRDASRAAVAAGARCATDVTGFGLLGHLLEMVSASAADVTVELARLPLLDGVRETIGLGIFSSLHPQNVRLRRAIRNPGEAAAALLYPALFDPQTAGGLLASVPGPRAAACLAALHAAGYGQAAIIGHVEPQSGAAEPITIVVGDSSPRSGIQANGRDEPGPEPRRLSARQPGSPVAP